MPLSRSSFISVLLLVCTACAQPNLEDRVRRLEIEADRQAAIRLMHAYAHGIDSLDEALLRETFADDAVAEYVGANFPMNERLEGIDAILKWLRANVGGRKNAVPWHYMSTALVDVDGDRATVRTFQHNRTLSGVGLYTIEARRTSAGWRIGKLHLDERILDQQLLESLHQGPSGSDQADP